MHTESSEFKDRAFEVEVDHHVLGPGPFVYHVEDWWDHLTGGSWGEAEGNPACMMYAIRAGFADLPPDDEVLYGHLVTPGGLGMLVHVSEIDLEKEVIR